MPAPATQQTSRWYSSHQRWELMKAFAEDITDGLIAKTREILRTRLTYTASKFILFAAPWQHTLAALQ